ncbi:hypothetical protein EV401DRAFT_1558286 [Pisolithus croceorrhizus]|nr:hypothetical protein EV401DRAFT_1558286 [Pisolithus croceorrhizus]
MVWSSRDFPGRDGDGQPLCSLDCPRIRSRSSGLAHKMIVTSPRTRTQLMSACYREPSTQTYKGFSASELISNCKFTRQIPIPRYRVHWSAVFMLASIAKGIHHTRIFLELSVYAREGNWLRNYCWGWVQGIVRCGNLVTTGYSQQNSGVTAIDNVFFRKSQHLALFHIQWFTSLQAATRLSSDLRSLQPTGVKFAPGSSNQFLLDSHLSLFTHRAYWHSKLYTPSLSL